MFKMNRTRRDRNLRTRRELLAGLGVTAFLTISPDALGQVGPQKTFVLSCPALFETGSARFSRTGARRVRALAERMSVLGCTSVAMNVYTDNRGSAKANLVLTQRRALAIRDIFSDAMPLTSVTATGWGARNPVHTNETPAGRERNRRVEAVAHFARQA
jgi:outer membrane protein OmpA-like peptidoglycan-associated protein